MWKGRIERRLTSRVYATTDSITSVGTTTGKEAEA